MARPEYALSMPGIQSMIIPIVPMAAANAAFAAHTLKVLMPVKAKIVGIGLNVGVKSGTFSTATLDVLAGATSLLAAAFDVAAATAATPIQKEDSALAAGAASVAAGTTINITTAESGGSSPVWNDVTVQIDYVRI